MKVRLTCGIEVSNRRKKNIPHVHKPGTCFSTESFPTILPFDPLLCRAAGSKPGTSVSIEQAPLADPEIDQEMDEILEDLAEEALE